MWRARPKRRARRPSTSLPRRARRPSTSLPLGKLRRLLGQGRLALSRRVTGTGGRAGGVGAIIRSETRCSSTTLAGEVALFVTRRPPRDPGQSCWLETGPSSGVMSLSWTNEARRRRWGVHQPTGRGSRRGPVSDRATTRNDPSARERRRAAHGPDGASPQVTEFGAATSPRWGSRVRVPSSAPEKHL